MIDICAKLFCNISKDEHFVGDTKVCPVTDKKPEKYDYFLVWRGRLDTKYIEDTLK